MLPCLHATPMWAGSSSPHSILPRSPRVAPKPLHPQTHHFEVRPLTHRAAHSSRRPVPKWGTFSSLPQPRMLYISSPMQRAAPTLHKTNTKRSLRRHLHNPWWVLGAQGLGTARQGTTSAKRPGSSLQANTNLGAWQQFGDGHQSPPGAGPPCRSLVQRFVSGRWKSRQIRPFLNPSQLDRQCPGECSHCPCPRVFKRGHILLLRMP